MMRTSAARPAANALPRTFVHLLALIHDGNAISGCAGTWSSIGVNILKMSGLNSLFNLVIEHLDPFGLVAR